jgi:hypothetical protein
MSTVEDVPPARCWTATETEAAARLAGWCRVATYGDFKIDTELSDSTAWRMVSVLRLWDRSPFAVAHNAVTCVDTPEVGSVAGIMQHPLG